MAVPVGAVPVGIDLGTTFSVIAYLDAHGRPTTVPNGEGELITPSVVLYERNGSVVVGESAKSALSHEPDRTIECVKQLMGRPTPVRTIDGTALRPQDVSAMILKKVKQDFERRQGPAGPAVITVPAWFTDSERCATRDAGRIAGLEVADIINEPTAAALAFVFEKRMESLQRALGPKRGDLVDRPEVIAVFDLGGGTFDMTIIRLEGKDVTVLATEGNIELGGKNWDEELAKLIGDRFRMKTGFDPCVDPGDRFELMRLAEEAKRELTDRLDTIIRCGFGGKREAIPVSRRDFETATAGLLSQTEITTDIVVEEAGLTWDQVDRLLLVGGSTRMPAVKAMLRRLTGKEPDAGQSADEVVAHGAAIHSAMRLVHREKGQLSQPRRPRVGKSGQPEIQYGVDLLPVLEGVTLRDVNSHSLGVLARNSRTRAMFNRILISKNSKLPARESHTFGLERDGQREARVRVLEGESERPEANRPLGDCIIEELPAGLRRESPVRVNLVCSENGIVEVEAIEMVSGKRVHARLDRTNGMSEAEIQARAHAARSIVID